MGAKGEQTKQLICAEAYKLFAKKGYKEVTMTDICDHTGLSRGGLYRHYESTEQIFLEIINALMGSQKHEFTLHMQSGIPAPDILNDVLTRYETEMLDQSASLSVAIYEFFSKPDIAKSGSSIARQYLNSKKMWTEFIQYGIERGEFKMTNPEAVYDLLVFSYQGVRMYGAMMDIDPIIPKRMMEQIKLLLLPESEGL